jgi:hypothetical protein
MGHPGSEERVGLAYLILQGMKDRWFTVRKLGQFVKDSQSCDYENAAHHY